MPEVPSVPNRSDFVSTGISFRGNLLLDMICTMTLPARQLNSLGRLPRTSGGFQQLLSLSLPSVLGMKDVIKRNLKRYYGFGCARGQPKDSIILRYQEQASAARP